MDIWIYVPLRNGEIDETTGGLAAEAQRLLARQNTSGRITGVVLGAAPVSVLEALGGFGIQRVLHADHDALARYHGEVFARALAALVEQEDPACLLMTQLPETEDLAQRTAALMQTVLITRAADFGLSEDGGAWAMRPVANGYLFEELAFAMRPAPIVLFLPAVLVESQSDGDGTAVIARVPLSGLEDDLQTRTIDVTEAAPEELDLAEADIIVAGGRGMGNGPSFGIIHDLARVIGGSVGGTRPIIDWGALPYERQIGQTGRYVAPRLIINCGISGANEYTAGMEKSQQVIAIDSNPRARIFRFADLGVVGDAHEILPMLITRIEDRK